MLGAGSELNQAYGAALASAINDWQAAEWIAADSRLRASIVLPWDDAPRAVAEIERCDGNDAFVQIATLVRTLEPLGRRRYWPLYAAACEAQLPIAVHFTGYSAAPLTGTGFPSFYIEERINAITSFQDQLTSIVCEGVLTRYPELKIVLVEGGFAWLPPLMWRLDRAWEVFREEVHEVDRRPSDLIRDHVYFTTQPLEEPPNTGQLEHFLRSNELGGNALFATDYPHFDFDAPTALNRELARSKNLLRAVLHDNAAALFKLS